MATHFDAIVIGAGQAGPPLAGRLTEAGWKIALVERKLFGGTCVNNGCTPTKALVASAHAAHLARRAADFGVSISGGVDVDMKRVKARKDEIVKNSRHGVESRLDEMEGCTVYRGQARLISRHEVQVGDDVLSAGNIFLNVGARPTIPKLPGIDAVKYLTSTTALELDQLPRHMVVVGGSYVGLEFAQIYRRLGAEVTVIEKGPRLLSHEDEDVSKCMAEILEAEGVKLRLDAKCIRFEPRGDDVAVHATCGSGEPEEVGSHVLLALGRTPNTDDLGLAEAGVECDEHGYVLVNDQLQTNVPGVWALGDCNGRGGFTHTSYNDFEIVATNLLDQGTRKVSDRIPAHAIYTDPPLGQVGMTETAVRQSGRPALMATRPMSRVNRAVEKGETQGFMKVLVDAETKRILGASILGTGGDEAIHGILDMMYAGGEYTQLQRTVAIHPTVSELIPTLLGDLKPLV